MTTSFINNDYECKVFECDDCGEQYTHDQLDPIVDIQERVSAGRMVPGGECPDTDCGCLCYPLDNNLLIEEAARPLRRCGHSACSQHYIDSGLEHCLGWDLFDSGERGYNIERDDSLDIFANDDEALDYAIKLAAAGDPRARLAIQTINGQDSTEWDALPIRARGRDMGAKGGDA